MLPLQLLQLSPNLRRECWWAWDSRDCWYCDGFVRTRKRFLFSKNPPTSVGGFLFYRQVLNNSKFGRGFWVLGSGVLGSGVRHCGRWMRFGWSKIMRICLTPSGEFLWAGLSESVWHRAESLGGSVLCLWLSGRQSLSKLIAIELNKVVSRIFI